MKTQLDADFGVEEFEVMFADGPKSIKADVYELATKVRAALAATDGQPVADRAAALNAVYAEYGLPPVGQVASERLASLICHRAIELKNELWATPSGPNVPGSPATSPASTPAV